ncbi:MAG: hypothetical protein M1829_000676 [Trizodia sp. TS-e1964]|nr:MAG: hypothetical protein M1829_000676 [Trizodia sp. TS-e1964]
MYAYKRVGPSIDEEGQFVFTSASPGLGISTNTFIPLNTLKTRLNGNKNERLNAYALDWKIAQGTHFNKCDSYYLGLRDSIGKPSKDYHFLKYLLGDEKETTRGLDIPSLIFKRWCAVAYVASKLAKNKWAVKARFWAFPSKVDLEITFFYKIGNFEIGNDNEYTALKYAILNAHEKAKNEVGKLEEGFESKVSYPKIEFLDDCKDLNGDNLESLGSHPQNFYKVFVTTSDAKKMEQNGYSFLVLDSPDPPSIHSPKRSQINKIPTENKGDTTTTLITNAKVKSVNDWPRCITQNAIMGGISAAEAAVEIWGGISPPRTFEWLHRSAYSYGGIEDGSPDSSQTPGNIVLGTYGANTSMIRYENYLKRLANDGKNVKLQTKKIQNMEIEDTDPISSWFFKFLEYTWTFPIPPNSYQILSHPGAFKQSHTFNLFSKQIPTRFEVETDEAFDAQWLGKEKNPKLEAAIYSVLEARREK